MSNIEKRLEAIESKIDLLLAQKFDASEKLKGGLQEPSPAPRKRQKNKVIDFKTMYRKKGIV
jgi:hypothetical protein